MDKKLKEKKDILSLRKHAVYTKLSVADCQNVVKNFIQPTYYHSGDHQSR